MVQSCDKNSLKVQCRSVYFGKRNAICRSEGMERLRQGKAFSLHWARVIVAPGLLLQGKGKSWNLKLLQTLPWCLWFGLLTSLCPLWKYRSSDSKKRIKKEHAIQIYIRTRKQTFKAHTLCVIKKCCHSIQPTFIKSCFRPEIILIINSDDLQTACPTVNKVFGWLLIEFLQFLCNENYYDPLLQTQKDQSWWPGASCLAKRLTDRRRVELLIICWLSSSVLGAKGKRINVICFPLSRVIF